MSPTLPAIDTVDTIEVRVPRRRFAASYARLPDAHHALVRVRAGDLVGIGEAPAELWWTGEDATSVRNAIARYLAPPSSEVQPNRGARRGPWTRRSPPTP